MLAAKATTSPHSDANLDSDPVCLSLVVSQPRYSLSKEHNEHMLTVFVQVQRSLDMPHLCEQLLKSMDPEQSAAASGNRWLHTSTWELSLSSLCAAAARVSASRRASLLISTTKATRTAPPPSAPEAAFTAPEARVEYSPTRSTQSLSPNRPQTAIPAREDSQPRSPSRQNRPQTAVLQPEAREVVAPPAFEVPKRLRVASASQALPALAPLRCPSESTTARSVSSAETSHRSQRLVEEDGRKLEQLEMLANCLADELRSADLEVQDLQQRLSKYESLESRVLTA